MKNYKISNIITPSGDHEHYRLAIEFTPATKTRAIQMFDGCVALNLGDRTKETHPVLRLKEASGQLIAGELVLVLSTGEKTSLRVAGSISVEREAGCYLISMMEEMSTTIEVKSDKTHEERMEIVKEEADIVDAILAERDEARLQLQQLLQDYEWLMKQSSLDPVQAQGRIDLLERITAAKMLYRIRSECYQAAETLARNSAVVARMEHGDEAAYRAYLKKYAARLQQSIEFQLMSI